MNEVFGYLAALLMGGTLGLIGGGGSILTVPIFVYLFEIAPTQAAAYSLFVVGLTALFGAAGQMKAGRVDLRAVGLFGVPSLLAVYATRRYLVPAIPEEIASVGPWVLSKDLLTMVVFAVVMLLAALSMLLKGKGQASPGGSGEAVTKTLPLIVLDGVFVGALTGFVGAGGGFLIVPALVWSLKLGMKEAVGTSLCIIAIKSLFGFLGDVQMMVIDWSFLGIFAAIAVCGILFGARLSERVPAAGLKYAFGWFVLIAGVGIFAREVVFAPDSPDLPQATAPVLENRND